MKHLWQRLEHQVFLVMTLQAWHTCICGVFPNLLCRSSQALSGLMGSVTAQYFQVSPEMLNRVQVQALAGPLKDIQRLVPKSLLRCLGCVLRVVSYWKVNLRPSLRYWVLTSLPVPAAEKHTQSMMLPPPCFTFGMVTGFSRCDAWHSGQRVQSWFH